MHVKRELFSERAVSPQPGRPPGWPLPGRSGEVAAAAARPLFLLAIVILLAAQPAAAQLGLGLSPMRVELAMAPGTQYSGSLSLSSDSQGKVRVRAELLDFFIDESETPQFDRSYPQEAEFSCRPWLSVNPMETELGAGTQTLVRYTIRVPREATERSFHCAAGFTTLPPAEQPRGMGLQTAVRIVAAFYVIIGKPQAEGAIKEIKLEPVPDPKQPSWRAVVVIENPSLMHMRPAGELAVLDASGKLLESLKFNSVPILPRRPQRFLFPLTVPVTAGASYTLRARVDLGLAEIQEATVEVTAPPAPTAVPAQ